MRTLRDNYRVNLRSMTILGCELSSNILYELIIDVVLYQVDGATTEAATHDTATCNTILLSYVVQEVELLATYFIFLAQTIVSFIHFLTYSLVGALIGTVTANTQMVDVNLVLYIALAVFAAAFICLLFIPIKDPEMGKTTDKTVFEHSPWALAPSLLTTLIRVR